RRLYDLPLVRTVQPFFAMSWTIMHEIDERSPFHGKTSDEIVAAGWILSVNVTGHDGTLSQTIYANTFYRADAIVFGGRYADVTRTARGGVITRSSSSGGTRVS